MKAVATSGKAVFFAGCTVIISLAGMYVIGIEFVSGLATAAIVAVALTIADVAHAVARHAGVRRQEHRPAARPGRQPRREHRARRLLVPVEPVIQRRPLPTAASRRWCTARPRVAGVRRSSSAPPTPATARRPTRPAAPTTSWPRASARASTARCCWPSSAPGLDDDALAKVHDAVGRDPGRGVRAAGQFNPQHDTAVMPVFPTTSPQDRGGVDLIHHLRGEVLPAARAGTGIEGHVGGITAAFDDVSELRRGPAAGLHRGRAADVIPPADGGVPIAARAVEGRDHEPAVDRRGLRRAGRGLPVGHRRVDHRRQARPDRGLPADDAVRHPVRAVDGLRGLPALAGSRRSTTARDNAQAVADGMNATARVITAAALDHGDGLRLVHVRRRPGLKEFGLGWRGRSSSTPRSCGWCSCRRRWSCSATPTGGCRSWLDRLLPNVHIEGEADLDHEIEELLESASVVEEKGAPR